MTALSLNAAERAEIHRLSPFSYMPEGLSAPFTIQEDIYHFSFFISVIFPWALPSTASYPIFSFPVVFHLWLVSDSNQEVSRYARRVFIIPIISYTLLCVFCCPFGNDWCGD